MDRIPVLLTFDLDGEIGTQMANIYGEPGIANPMMGQYGPKEGVFNILKLLKEECVKASFQIVGKIAEMYPNVIHSIHNDGHELALHSYTHRDYQTLTYQEIDEEIKRTKNIIKSLTGIEAIGHRSPFWRTSTYIKDLLVKNNLLWNSDAYTVFEEKNFIMPYKLVNNVIEIPSSERTEDWTCLLIRKLPLNEVSKLWLNELLMCYQHQTPCTLVMHPFITGKIKNLPLLKSIINFVKNESEKYFFIRPKDYLVPLTINDS